LGSPLLAVVLALAFGQAAYAAACCDVPRNHEIRVPRVVVAPPSNGCGSSCGGCKQNCGGGDKDHNGNKRFGSFEFQIDVNANANASSSASARSLMRSNLYVDSVAFGLGGAINGSAGYGFGGGGGFWVGQTSSYIPNLSVDAEQAVQVPYQATRSWFKTVAIMAVCMDAKMIPHPASQVIPGRDVAESYDGELFRCLAGAQMQYTIADYSGEVSFDKGQTVTCAKNQALHHSPGGKLECRAQKAARDCNERSLLRRYGAGIKILKMAYTETYTAYRTEMVQSSASASAALGMALDGGVGGVVY
jgi:hypothetical protein